jgi:hypothetical protein
MVAKFACPASFITSSISIMRKDAEVLVKKLNFPPKGTQGATRYGVAKV